jgi:hypothetical protein
MKPSQVQIDLCGVDVIVSGKVLRVARPELEKYEPIEHPEVIIDALGGLRERVDLFTFLQIDADAPRLGHVMEWENLAILPVSTFDHWFSKQIRSEARNRARQAEKRGVKISERPFDETLVKGIWEVYNESPIRQGKQNVHYGKDINTVRREAETFLDRSIFIGAYLDEQLIGFVKLVTDRDRTRANTMNIVAMVKHRDKATTNALIAHSVRACAERGIRYLCYQNFTYGKKAPDNLTNFKQVNGFERVDVPRYYVPLTTLGAAAIHLGLHHRLTDWIPESIAQKLRAIRSDWYERRLAAKSKSDGRTDARHRRADI